MTERMRRTRRLWLPLMIQNLVATLGDFVTKRIVIGYDLRIFGQINLNVLNLTRLTKRKNRSIWHYTYSAAKKDAIIF